MSKGLEDQEADAIRGSSLTPAALSGAGERPAGNGLNLYLWRTILVLERDEEKRAVFRPPALTYENDHVYDLDLIQSS